MPLHRPAHGNIIESGSDSHRCGNCIRAGINHRDRAVSIVRRVYHRTVGSHGNPRRHRSYRYRCGNCIRAGVNYRDRIGSILRHVELLPSGLTTTLSGPAEDPIVTVAVTVFELALITETVPAHCSPRRPLHRPGSRQHSQNRFLHLPLR